MIEKYPNVELKKAAQLRDKIVHDYFGVDLLLVWKVIEDELPNLLAGTQRILKEEFGANE